MTKTLAQRLFKKNKLVLTSGMASIVGYPGYFSYLPLLNPLNMDLKHLKTAQSTPNPIGRRAQSMSVLPRAATDEDDDGFAEFEKECAEFEAHRGGLILSMEQTETVEFLQSTHLPIVPTVTSSIPKRYEGLGHRGVPSRTQARHPQQPRRIQSAPCVALSLLPPSLLDEIDQWEDDFTLNEWVIPEIRQEAEKVPDMIIEAWDEDFDEQDEFEIPKYMQSVQTQFKTDMIHMKKFALHIKVFENANILVQGLELEYKDDIVILKNEFNDVLCQITTLIHLADYNDEVGSTLSGEDLEVLEVMLRGCEIEKVKVMLKEKNIMFGNEIMSYLLLLVPSLKKNLVTFVEQMRSLINQ